MVFFNAQIKNQLFTSPIFPSDTPSSRAIYSCLYKVPNTRSSQVLQSWFIHALCLQNEILKGTLNEVE